LVGYVACISFVISFQGCKTHPPTHPFLRGFLSFFLFIPSLFLPFLSEPGLLSGIDAKARETVAYILLPMYSLS
jgi:hypothetical protein